MAQLVRECNTAVQAIGHVSYKMQEQEKNSLIYRLSLYIVKDMKAGDVITDRNVRSVRPGYGLAPKYLPEILGKRVNRDLKKGERMRLEYIE